MKCLSQVNNGNWCQETYETSTKSAAKRAKELRKMGYAVTVGSMGSQITTVGSVKLTQVDIRPGSNQDTFGLPEVEMIRWN